MVKFVIQALFFYWIWSINRKKKGAWFLPSSFLLGIYALSAICAIPTLYWGEYSEPFSSHYWIPVVEFSLLVFIFIFPFILFNENSIERIELPSRHFLDLFSLIIIILSFYAIFFYMANAREVLSSANVGLLREQIASGEEEIEGGILNTIASVSSSLYVFALLLFFVYII